jgi:multiple sugar transport system ATP-binding protein
MKQRGTEANVAEVQFENATRRFSGSDRPAVDALDLDIADGEFLVLVGPSGCGKTTSLRMLAGLETVDDGAILIGGRNVTDLAPRDRDVAMVFQSYALYPHMSVADNMGFALKVAGVGMDERDRSVKRTAEMLDLGELLERRPRALSGGQRHRVAMGRAIVRQPQAFLMDEPLSNLDAQLRVQTRAEIHRLQRDLGITTVYVTHDQVEAMTMGDRVAVMRDGLLQQVDTPQNVYDSPANRFVASFIGSPSMNLIEGKLSLSSEEPTVSFERHTLTISADALAACPRLASYSGRDVLVGIRPEDFHDASLGTSSAGSGRIEARCDVREALGSDVLVHFSIGATNCIARLAPQSRVSEGEQVALTVNQNRLHFFYPETGVAINGGRPAS